MTPEQQRIYAEPPATWCDVSTSPPPRETLCLGTVVHQQIPRVEIAALTRGREIFWYADRFRVGEEMPRVRVVGTVIAWMPLPLPCTTEVSGQGIGHRDA